MITTDKTTKDIIISGFEQGIADSPYLGISDIRNINLISVPKEASVNFATALIAPPTFSTYGTVVSAVAATDVITFTGATGLAGNTAIYFAGASLPAGITAGTFYWVGTMPSSTTMTIYSDSSLNTIVDITGTGTGTFNIVNMSKPKYFAYNSRLGYYYLVDSIGQIWSNSRTTFTSGGTGTAGYWIYIGNKIPATGTTVGNGIAYYQGSSGEDWIFVFHNSSIDYIKNPTSTTPTWVYQWNPTTGASLGYASTPTKILKTAVSPAQNSPHETFNAPDNVIYFTDAQYIGRFFEATGDIFDPTDNTSYIYDETRLLPFTDIAQCLSFLGTSLMIGGKQNIIYPWDTTSPTFSYPILLAEYNIVRMVTVNTNTFIFVGNRGRIYYTNGTNAQLYKKIPDHLSGTIEPYFTWGGACSNKNQLYFSALATDNGGNALTAYGGLWGIDLDSQAIRLTNKLSYGTYAGYSTAMIPNFASAPAGTGLYIGWQSGTTTYGIDTTVGTPYVNGEAYIDSDLIPIGTFLKPNTNARVEFKLSMPLVEGETVSLWYRQKFSDSFVQIGTTTTYTTNGSGTTYSDVYPSVAFEKSQWVQIRAVLTSTASSPSYVRLTEIRLGQG